MSSKWTLPSIAALAVGMVLVFGSMNCAQAADTGGTSASAPATSPTSIVNARCPILGSKLDRANVPDKLTRTYKGQRVGFCCDGCPQAWDKLSDAEKDKKLQAAMQPAK